MIFERVITKSKELNEFNNNYCELIVYMVEDGFRIMPFIGKEMGDNYTLDLSSLYKIENKLSNNKRILIEKVINNGQILHRTYIPCKNETDLFKTISEIIELLKGDSDFEYVKYEGESFYVDFNELIKLYQNVVRI